MWPELFTIAGLPLRSFGFFVAMGFLVGVQVSGWLSKRYGTNPKTDAQHIPDVSWYVLIGVIAGARLAYVLVNLPYYLEHPGEIFMIWQGGLVMYGGMILALVLGIWKARQLGMHIWQTADYCLTAAFLGQAVGRIGCLMVGDDYGKVVPDTASGGTPWYAIRFPDPLPAGSAFPPELAGLAVHATQPYMTLKALAVFGIGMWLLPRKKFHGQVTCLLLMAYAVLRAFVEMFRGDAQARGGFYREGLAPEDVTAKLNELGVAAPNGRIVDVEGYRELLRQGTAGVQAELLISTSQMVAIATFTIAVILYQRLRRSASSAMQA